VAFKRDTVSTARKAVAGLTAAFLPASDISRQRESNTLQVKVARAFDQDHLIRALRCLNVLGGFADRAHLAELAAITVLIWGRGTMGMLSDKNDLVRDSPGILIRLAVGLVRLTGIVRDVAEHHALVRRLGPIERREGQAKGMKRRFHRIDQEGRAIRNLLRSASAEQRLELRDLFTNTLRVEAEFEGSGDRRRDRQTEMLGDEARA